MVNREHSPATILIPPPECFEVPIVVPDEKLSHCDKVYSIDGGVPSMGSDILLIKIVITIHYQFNANSA